jgi:anti-sigma-K factor RskA
MTVRRVSAETPPGKSYELWLVSNDFPAPRSLGLVGKDEFVVGRPLLFASQTISDATYAVTEEPEGGSPTGFATGPIVYAGKLLEVTPDRASPPR